MKYKEVATRANSYRRRPCGALSRRRTFLKSLGAVAGAAMFPRGDSSAQETESPEQAILRLVEGHRIINVHEHVQGAENTAVMLDEMDALGIGLTVLVGSPWFTIALYERAGFTRYEENNAAIVSMAQANPLRFEAWPTVNPLGNNEVDKLQNLVAAGATGAKLYLGHGYTSSRENKYVFHPIAMDDPRMFDVYEYLVTANLPVCFHVNPAKPGFMDEFIAVLRRFPDLKVNTPHYMLSSMVHSRLEEMFATFPNLVADISFGHDDYLKTGLQRISSNPIAFRRLFETYPKKFLFGTDFVVTSIRPHDHEWYRVRLQAYLDMLSLDTYTTPLLEGRTLRGLALPPPLLENILFRNFETFKSHAPRDTVLARDLDWNRLRVPTIKREPGQALSPPVRRAGDG